MSKISEWITTFLTGVGMYCLFERSSTLAEPVHPITMFLVIILTIILGVWRHFEHEDH